MHLNCELLWFLQQMLLSDTARVSSVCSGWLPESVCTVTSLRFLFDSLTVCDQR